MRQRQSRTRTLRVFTIVVALLLTKVAWADSVLESFGSATVTQSDPAAARNRALDDAFRQAVDQIIAGLIDPDVREKQADLIKKRVLRRSRVYVSRYKLLSESEEQGVYQVRIEASVADAAIASDLKA